MLNILSRNLATWYEKMNWTEWLSRFESVFLEYIVPIRTMELHELKTGMTRKLGRFFIKSSEPIYEKIGGSWEKR